MTTIMSPRLLSTARRFLLLSAIAALAISWLPATHRTVARAQGTPGPCDPPNNAIVCENSKTGNPASQWDVNGIGDDTIQGFTTDISYAPGDTVHFKVDTAATGFRLDIYRLGYYAGLGARKMATVSTTVATSQPDCIVDDATGLIDCGNWSESATWQVPLTAVSGIYIAKAIRTDNGGASHIAFIVRNDTSHSDLLFQTSDTTWQAYNRYGGNSLYVGGPDPDPARAYKVSYNRPFITRGETTEDWLFNAEYPMIRFLEANGFDVSYTTGVDTDRRGSELLEHKAFMSVGHDEYWSGPQRANVEAARAAGVNLAFFSGNEIFWKTRWEPSIDGSNTSRRTLVCYKETHANAKIDPTSTWTGTWRDPRFSPPADGNRPENALTGTIFTVNSGTTEIRVPAAFSALRFWRNTSIALLQPNETATFPSGTLGYEWDSDLDNGSRPVGLVDLSQTVVSGVSVLQDYGSNYAPATAVHSLTMYRHASGALVFSAGTIQWTWGLDSTHDRGDDPPNQDMQQATVNLFADMGAQPQTLQAGLVPATKGTDTVPPTSSITTPVNGATVAANSTVTIVGTAQDNGGGSVGAVDVSVDGGLTWHRASGRSTWTYSWPTGAPRTVVLKSRATDDSGNIEVPSNAVSVTVSNNVPLNCPCSIWSTASTPIQSSDADSSPNELGIKFKSDVAGYITAVKYYKSPENTGIHVGNLWTSTGTLLASATFTSESDAGWQMVTFGAPVAITPNTVYVASYHTTTGHYASDEGTFALAGVDNGPLHALSDAAAGGNGVFRTHGSGFPDQSFNATNYWVDIEFRTTVPPDTTPPTVANHSPLSGAIDVSTTNRVSIVFNEPMMASTINTSTLELRSGTGTIVPATVTYTVAGNKAQLTPSAALAPFTNYAMTVKSGAAGVKDVAGNAMTSDVTWSFTTGPAAPPPPDTGPGGPIVIITSSSNPFTKYYAELLRTEGLNAFALMDISQVTSASLAPYDVAILGEMTLTTTQVSTLTSWVTGGGNLVAMRPDKKLASLLGLNDASSTLSNQYLLFNTAAAPGAGIVSQTLQFHGTADRYTLNGATALGTLYSNASTPTSNPAVTVRSVGVSGGQAAAFTFDLAKSVVYTRQGNPAWSGQERDGQAPIRSDDLFFGAAAGDPQPDWVDLNKVAIPQADEQQRFLANLIGFVNQDRKPLPRFWYFPNGKKAVIVMTGDDHANGGTRGRFDQFLASSPANCSLNDWECIRGTSYIYAQTPISDAEAATYASQGFEIALHVNTDCADWTPTTLESYYSDQLDALASAFPSLTTPTTNRTHCIVWSDYSSQPQVELNHGIRLDTSYYYWPPTWVNDRPGLYTGSGMPMRFATSTGAFIDVYQATTQMTDESAQSYPFTVDTLLDRALGPEGYYGAFTANLHTDQSQEPQSDATIASALARGVSVITARQMLVWLDARNSSSFANLAFSGNTLTFNVNAAPGANRLQGMLPVSNGALILTSVMRDGVVVPTTTQTIKGVTYALFAATSGAYTATYAADTFPPVISLVQAAPGTTTATITWTTDEGSTSRVDYGTNPASLGSNVTNSTLVNSHTVSLTGLTPGATYFFRVSSTDGYNNTGTSPASPAAPARFNTAAPSAAVSFTDTLATDFTAGTPGTLTYVAQTGNGEVTLTPLVGAEFSGSTLPTGWSSVVLNTGGVTTVSGGTLVSDATRVSTDALFSPGLSMQFVATFTGAGFQHVGLGLTLNETPWAIFSTKTGGGLFARTNNGATTTDTQIGGSWFGAPHLYRIDWAANGVTYFIDGTQVASHPIGISQQMRPIVTDLNAGGGGVTADWVRLSPYAATGTYLSRVFDAGSATSWGAGTWTATVPSGTSLVIGVRTGNTAVPDASWTPFADLSGSGEPIGGTTRYVQYRAVLTTTNPANTPVLSDITLGGAPFGGQPALSVNDTSVSEGNGGTTNAVFTVTLSAPSAQSVTVNYATASGTATAGTDFTPTIGTLTFPAGTTSRFLSVPVIGDTLVEGTETFTVTLSGPVGAVLARPQGVGAIIDDDAPPPPSVFTDTTVVQFSTGTGDGQSYITQTADGELTLAPTLGVEFGDSACAECGGIGLPQGWTSTPWNTGETAAVGNGIVTVDGTLVGPQALSGPYGSLEFVATFSHDTFEHVGLAQTFNEPLWAIFSTASGGAGIYVRTNDGSGTIDTFVPGNFPGSAHRYRIDWTPTAVTYFIDGTQVASHAASLAQQLRPVISDFNIGAGAVTVDWMRMTPYAASSTFLSRVFDAGLPVNWGSASWTATTPTGTGLAMAIRYGDTSTPDGSWTPYTPLPSSGTALNHLSRYSQYQAVLSTTASSDTPTLQDVTIAAVPLPTVSVADTSVAEGNSGTTAATFTVSLSAASASTVSVHYSTANGTATAGTDYTASSGVVTFPAGTTVQTITVPVIGETAIESDETFTVTLDSPTNATLSRSVATGTILNDDLPALSIADSSVTEGNSGTATMTFTVTMSTSSPQTVTVNYATANGTATAPGDFTATSGTLTFPSGTTSQTFTVPVVGDTTVEADETFTATLTNPSNATFTRSQATGTITNDEVPTLSINSASVTEGNFGSTSANFTVTLSQASPLTVTVGYNTTPGTATAGADYSTTSGTLTFSPGQTSKSLSVAVLGDTLDENDETFSVNLSAPVNATVSTGTGTGTILDNDATPSLSITNSVNVQEGDSGTRSALLTVSLSAASGRPVTVNYATANGTATVGSDYTATAGTLTFQPGAATTQTIAVVVLGDTTAEANETVLVNLSSPTNATISGTGQGVVTIVTDDPKLSIGSVSVTEGDSGSVNATFIVTLSQTTTQSVSVNYATANGTAASGSDYTTTSGVLTIPANTASGTISVPVLGDLTNENSETFTVTLSNPVNAGITTAVGTGTIVDNDGLPSLSIGSPSVVEGDSGARNLTFAVTLSPSSGKAVTVGYATANGTATAGSDYVAASGTLTFAAGTTTQNINVVVTGDNTVEPSETVLVNLSNPVNATISAVTGTGTITNDDPKINTSDASVTEGNAGAPSAVFTVTLSQASPSATVTVNYATTAGTATAGTDFTTTSGTLTFAPGVTSLTIPVPVLDDAIDEPNETFTVTLSNPVNAAIADGTGVGTIVDNDPAPTIAINDVTATEGNSGTQTFTFTVSLSAASAQTVSVNYATANGTATAGTFGTADYIATSGTLTFSAGQTTRTISVQVRGDTTRESNDTFFVNLSNAANATIADSQGIGTITNDD